MGFLIEDLRQTSIDNWYTINDALMDSELELVDKLQESIPFREAALGTDKHDLEEYRKSKIKWLAQQVPECRWLYEKMVGMVSEANNSLWKFELSGIFDNLQYTVYEAGGGHYDWHMDIGSGPFSRRKISITLQLSEPDEYEGGDLEFMVHKDIIKLPRKKGCVIIFPSFFVHRITPVTKGVRKSLVLWISGPPYR